jgi:hypothetical protein
MAAVTKGVRPSLADMVPSAEHYDTGMSGGAIEAGDMIYKKESDNLYYVATGAAVAEAARAWGMALDDCGGAGEPVTCVFGCAMGYKPLTGGSPILFGTLYLGPNGKLDTVATTGDTVGVVRILNSDGAVFIRTRP